MLCRIRIVLFNIFGVPKIFGSIPCIQQCVYVPAIMYILPKREREKELLYISPKRDDKGERERARL
jgi:hypothetical protein